jgi:Holliday junction resolvase
MSKQKAKGTLAEVQLLKYLQDNNLLAVRNPPSGVKDKGDLTILGKPSVTIEVKNCKTMQLSEWVKEAVTEKENAGTDIGLVIHKKARTQDPSKWYCTLPVSELLNLLGSVYLNS